MIGPDVVVVGGGIAGLSLASALARDGQSVVVLEASLAYVDRVRGESMVPWGVAEAKALGVLPTLLEAGARITETWVHYDAIVPTEMSIANPIPAAMMHPDSPGSVNLRHPEACAALAARALGDGVEIIRGVTDVRVVAGQHPEIAATMPDGESLQWRPRLVVGADGRNSTVRRQVGIQLERHEATHMVAGLLVDGLGEVKIEHDFLATSDDLFMASFRQKDGQVRVYLCPSVNNKDRFAGHNGLVEFLRSANFGCLPFGEQLSIAKPIGPLATYPGDDTWTPKPYVDGMVLVGDSAGYNSPIIGQGLSIALRDARMVRDALRAPDDLEAGLRAYGDGCAAFAKQPASCRRWPSTSVATGRPDAPSSSRCR